MLHLQKFIKCSATGVALRSTVFAITALSIGSVGFAQASDTITLEFDGRDSLTGAFLGYDGDSVRILASVGELSIPAEDVTCIGPSCPDALRAEESPSDTVFKAIDGSATITGQLLDAEAEFYLVKTSVGVMRLDRTKVICEGAGCLGHDQSASQTDEVVLINGPVTLEGKLVGVEEDVFILETEALGIINVNRVEFSCLGPSCP